MKNFKFLALVLSCICIIQSIAQIPTITNFTPSSGPVGISVNISGTNFNATASNNIVYFGATKALVTSSSTTSIMVIVPTGATNKPITVLNTSTHLMASSPIPFNVTFNCGYISSTSIDLKMNFSTGLNSSGINFVLGDIDGDGKSDLVSSAYDTMSVCRNISSSGSITKNSFAAPVKFAIPKWGKICKLGDIDGDGKLDVAISNSPSGDDTIVIFRNTSTNGVISNNSFASAIMFPMGVNYHAFDFELGDIDLDGKLDLVVISSSQLYVFRNTSTSGTISSGSFAAKVDLSSLVDSLYGYPKLFLGDIDGDMKVDIIIRRTSKSIAVLRFNSTPGNISLSNFSATIKFVFNYYLVGDIKLGDIDGDGKLDIIVSEQSGINVYRNVSTPSTFSINSFPAVINFPAGLMGVIHLCDMDGDGKLDIIIAGGNYAGLKISRNTSTIGNISIITNLFVYTGVYDLNGFDQLGDVDGDGKPDMLFRDGDSVSVFRNSGLATPIVSLSSFNDKICNSSLSTKLILNNDKVKPGTTLYKITSDYPNAGSVVYSADTAKPITPFTINPLNVNPYGATKFCYIVDNGSCGKDSATSSVLSSNMHIVFSQKNIQCYGDSSNVRAIVSGGIPPFIYNWYNTANHSGGVISNKDSAINLKRRMYYVSVSDSIGCNFNDSIFINQPPQTINNGVCAVTVDSASGKNLVIWEKTGVIRATQYKIYKETSTLNQFNLIGIKASNLFSTFIDTLSVPLQKSDRYKISVVDSCGQESDLSSFHKTIHLSSNIGVNNEVNLSWNFYEGATYNTHYIMRSINGAAFIEIGQLSSASNSYTDLTPPIGLKKYRIEVDLPNSCNPTMKTNGISMVTSNVVMVNPIGISSTAFINKIKVYPNPASDKIIIEGSRNLKMYLYDLLGQKVIEASNVNELSLIGLTNGIYFIRIYDKSDDLILNEMLIKKEAN